MSAQQNRLTPAPVRQDALCMCATGRSCSSFAAGHAVHLIQSRLVSATPSEWVDAIAVHSATDGTLTVLTLEGREIELWNGSGAAASVPQGSPVAFHPRYHALHAGGRLLNVLVV